VTTLANFKPNGSDGSGVTLELEASDISAYPEPDRSVEGLANAENKTILLNPGATIEQSERTEVGGIPAYKIVHSNALTPDDMWKTMNMIIATSNMGYMLTFISYTGQDTYGIYAPVVDSMIKSIKIDGSKKC
jgi:hypothetical protein